MNKLQLVSVIMPVYNAEKYLEEAVRSILNQSFTSLELLAIDDQSTDRSRSLLEEIAGKDSRVRILDGPRRGISAAKNLGVSQCKGDVVMFCDADDVYPADRIAAQLDWLNNHPDAGAVCGGYTMMDSEGKNEVVLNTGANEYEITEELLNGKARSHLCAFAVKRTHIQDTEAFREYFLSAEDIDFQFRLAETCRVFYLPKASYRYRLHDSSITHRQANNKREFYERMARTFCQQRRETGLDDLQNGIPPLAPQDFGVAKKSNIHMQGILIGDAWQLLGKGQKIAAIKRGFAACRLNMADPLMWKSFLMLIVKSFKY